MTKRPSELNLESGAFGAFLAALAAKRSTPGGGAVAGAIAALAAALGEMVVNFSAGKKSLAAHAGLHESATTRLRAMRSQALALAEEDAAAYGRLSALMQLPAEDERRGRGWGDAVRASIDAPRRMALLGLDALRLCEELTGATSRYLRSDLAIAAIAAEAAVASALWNVRINAPLLGDEARRIELEGEADDLAKEASRLREEVEEACRAT